MNIEQLKYPIGKYEANTDWDKKKIDEYISVIENFPNRLSEAVEHLNGEQLDTPYRPEGWTIRQVVHHCADSHMNAMIRFKLTLTEDLPTIKPYLEAKWAELADSRSFPIEASIGILNGLHHRWAFLLRSLTRSDLMMKYLHPEQKKEVPLYHAIGLYAWHCNHHLAHIVNLKKSKNWN